MQYEINEQLLNSILNYLATKPYAEVYQLISELQQLKPLTSKKK